MSLSKKTSNTISKRKEKAKEKAEEINKQAMKFMKENPESVQSHEEYKRDIIANARAAIDYKSPEFISKLQVNAAKARAAIVNPKANAANARAARKGTHAEIMKNARAAVNDEDPGLIAKRQARMAKARSQTKYSLLKQLPEGLRETAKEHGLDRDQIKSEMRRLETINSRVSQNSLSNSFQGALEIDRQTARPPPETKGPDIDF
jgi:hypothetical protein